MTGKIRYRATRFDSLVDLVKRLQSAERKSLAAMERRGSLPAGSSRARVTTANADWARAAEHRDLCERAVEKEIVRLGLGRLESNE